MTKKTNNDLTCEYNVCYKVGTYTLRFFCSIRHYCKEHYRLYKQILDELEKK